MPPKQKYTKELIAKTAVLLIERDGIEKLSHRTIANELNCSTQPVLSNFATMDDVRIAAREIVDSDVTEFVKQGAYMNESPLFGMAMAYIQYAEEHPNLTLFLILDNHFATRSKQLMNSIRPEHYLDVIMERTGLSAIAAGKLFGTVWIFVHGMMVMRVSGIKLLSMEQIEEYIKSVETGMTEQLRKEYPSV